VPNAPGLHKKGVTTFANIPLLGSASPRQLAEKVDFDGDGLRDIAVWIPPTATARAQFKIYLSSKNHSTVVGQYMRVYLGDHGDIPLVADMSGDGITDVIVFQPGGGLNRNDPTDTTGIWRWCATNPQVPTSTTCSSPNVAEFGARGDIPLPGLRFGTDNSQSYLAYFRPKLGRFFWRPVNNNTVLRYAVLGGPHSVPLPGLYGLAGLTDLAVYAPTTGEFKLLLSKDNWTSPITRSFGSKFVPSATGDSAARSGAIVLKGMTRNAAKPVNTSARSITIPLPRRVFSLYFPAHGTWHTMWDPIESDVVSTCFHGDGAKDVPIPGLDVDGDGYSELAFLREDTPGASVHIKRTIVESGDTRGQLLAKSPPTRICPGTEDTLDYPIWWPKSRFFVVSDMKGDGKPDILLWDPDMMEIVWEASDEGYESEGYGIYIADDRAILL
jgi:hypothetical protein